MKLLLIIGKFLFLYMLLIFFVICFIGDDHQPNPNFEGKNILWLGICSPAFGESDYKVGTPFSEWLCSKGEIMKKFQGGQILRDYFVTSAARSMLSCVTTLSLSPHSDMYKCCLRNESHITGNWNRQVFINKIHHQLDYIELTSTWMPASYLENHLHDTFFTQTLANLLNKLTVNGLILLPLQLNILHKLLLNRSIWLPLAKLELISGEHARRISPLLYCQTMVYDELVKYSDQASAHMIYGKRQNESENNCGINYHQWKQSCPTINWEEVIRYVRRGECIEDCRYVTMRFISA